MSHGDIPSSPSLIGSHVPIETQQPRSIHAPSSSLPSVLSTNPNSPNSFSQSQSQSKSFIPNTIDLSAKDSPQISALATSQHVGSPRLLINGGFAEQIANIQSQSDSPHQTSNSTTNTTTTTTPQRTHIPHSQSLSALNVPSPLSRGSTKPTLTSNTRSESSQKIFTSPPSSVGHPIPTNASSLSQTQSSQQPTSMPHQTGPSPSNPSPMTPEARRSSGGDVHDRSHMRPFSTPSPHASASNVFTSEGSRRRSVSTDRRQSGDAPTSRSRSNTRNSNGNLNVTVSLSRRSSVEEDEKKRPTQDHDKANSRRASAIALPANSFSVDASFAASNAAHQGSTKRRKSSIMSLIRGLADDPEKKSKSFSRSLKESGVFDSAKFDIPVITPLEILPTYVPELVRKRFATALDPLKGPENSTFFAATLFADISGFTPFAERLCSKGAIGVEILTEHLNAYFDQLIGLVEVHGGDILKFAGDAVLVMWYGEEDPKNICRRCVQCALDIQQYLNKYDFSGDKDRSKLDLYSMEEEFTLNLHIGIGAGEVTAFYVGGVDGKWEFLVGGHPLAQFSVAVEVAEPGEVVMSRQAWEYVNECCIGSPTFSDCYKAVSIIQELDQQTSEFTMISETAASLIGAFVPQSVHYTLSTGQMELCGELRRVTVLFIQLPDLIVDSYSTMAKAMLALQNALVIIQKVLVAYEGTVRQFMIDDKGCVLIAAFGLPPFSHENDCERATRAAMKARADLQSSGYQSKIGVTTGRAFCGSVGNYRRQEYAMVGDIVNLAARLMSASKQYGILCDQPTRDGALKAIQFETVPPMMFKGKSERIQAYRPSSFLSTDTNSGSNKLIDTFIGRFEERETFYKRLDNLRQGKGGIIFVQGEAGVGKTHVITEFHRMAAQKKIQAYRGGGDSIEQRSPFYAWRASIKEMLGIGEIENVEKTPKGLADFLQTCGFDLLSDFHRNNEVGSSQLPQTQTSHESDSSSTRGFRPELVRYLQQNQGNGRRSVGSVPLPKISDKPKGEDTADTNLSIVPTSETLPPLPPVKEPLQSSSGRRKKTLPPLNITHSSNRQQSNHLSPEKSPRADSSITGDPISPAKETTPLQSPRSIYDPNVDRNDHPHTVLESEAQPTMRKRSSSNTSAHDGDRRRSRSFLASMMTLPALSHVSKIKDESALQLAPLFNSLLQMDIPETDVTRSMTAQARSERLTILLFRLLRRASFISPFFVTIDDAQWLDTSSWGLIHDICSQLPSVLVVLSMRPFKVQPNSDAGKLLQHPNSSIIRLPAMKEEEMYQMLCAQLKVMQIAPEVFRLVYEKSQGNPFFSSELISVLKEDGDLAVDEANGTCGLSQSINSIHSVRLPETLEAVVTNRIDRLSASEQLTLKVASVMGRRFMMRMLLDIHPSSSNARQIEQDLITLDQMEYITTSLDEDSAEVWYAFRNILTQEVAYNLFPFIQRQRLHLAVADWYEKHMQAEELNPICHLLAFHWSRAQNDQKAAHYLELAGERANRNGLYDDVIQYFHELVNLTNTANLEFAPERLARWQRHLGNAQFSFGDLQWAKHHLEKASSLLSFPIPQGKYSRRLRSGIFMVKMFMRETSSGCLCNNNTSAVIELNPDNPEDGTVEAQAQLTQSASTSALDVNRLLCEVYLSCGFHSLYELVVRRFTYLAVKHSRNEMVILSRSFRCIGALIRGHQRRAQQHRMQVLKLLQEMNSLNSTICHALSLLGYYSISTGDWDEYEVLQVRVADELEEHESWQYWEEANIMLSYYYLFKGLTAKAEDIVARTLDSAIARDARRGLCWSFILLAELQTQRGQYHEATVNVTNCTSILLESLDYENFCIKSVSALVSYRRGDLNEAVTTANLALAFYEEKGFASAYFLIPSLHHLGEVYVGCLEAQETRSSQAGPTYKAALRQLVTVTEWLKLLCQVCPIAKAAFHLYQGHVLLRKEKRQHAMREWKMSLAASQENGILVDEAMAYFEIGMHCEGAERVENLSKAQERLQRLGDPHILGKCQVLLPIQEDASN
eukprot:TRINITY_DN3969_c0_g2_i1.p1 TRINITY_DN3969_c0_g2~~TRINITY_DN3969_c0_g2_i1.p1  ORF type:complete len:2015 (-),score=364.82 TRINITY_DN3969_c0_g2_i1:559-6603(-)